MSDFWKYLNNKVKKEDDDNSNKNYKGEVGYVPDSYLIGKKTHSNVTIDECINYAKSGDGRKTPSIYFGFRDSNDQTKCWIPNKGEYSFDNTKVNKPKRTKSSDMAMYFTPTGEIKCGSNKDCIKHAELSKIEQQKKKYADQVEEAHKKAENLALTKFALEKGITFEEAKKQRELELKARKATEDMHKKINEQKKLLEKLNEAKKHQKSLENAFSAVRGVYGTTDPTNTTNTTNTTIDSKIENNYDQISKLDSNIVKTSELIDNNNRLFFMKGKVTKVLVIILSVLAVIGVIMITYYSSKAGLIKPPKGLATFVGLNPKNATKSISAKLTTPANSITMGRST